MNNDVIYKEASQKGSENYLKLLLKYYKNFGLSNKSIEWEYYLNPFGKAKIFIAEYKNEHIGLIVNIPLKFQNNTGTYNGFRVQDLITDTNLIRKQIRLGFKIPKKNGLGICSNLMKINNDFLDKKTDFGIGFPNEKSLHFFEKTQWESLFNIPLYIKETNSENNFKLKYSVINKFETIHEEMWEKNIGNKLDIVSSKEYLNWRYFLNPKSKYKIFEIKDGQKNIGYLILKSHLLENNIMIGHICQFACEDQYTEDVINFTINYFSSLSIKQFSIWTIKDESFFLKNLGFKKVFLKNRKFIYRGNKKLKKKDWNLSMSYSDVY